MSYEPPPYGSPPPPPPGGGYGAPPPPGGGYGAPPPAGGGYGAPPPGGPYGAPPGYGGAQPQSTSVLAIISLVCGIVGILGACCCGFLGVFGTAAVICGFLAKKEIDESGGAKKGGGLAMAGMITGAVGIVLGVGLAILWFGIGAFDYGYY